MRIGGVQWTSVIDYPGKLATTLFTVGCDLRCPFCQNRSLVIPDEYPNIDAFLTDEIVDKLLTRKRYLSARVITGGEPCIQPDIVTFCQMIKKNGFLIKLDTNGTHPKILQQLLDRNLLDYVAMDYKAPLNRYAEVTASKVDPTQIRQSLDILTDPKLTIPIEFRTTVAHPVITLDDVREIIDDLVSRNVQRFYLQQARQPDHPLVDKECNLQPYPKKDLEEFLEKEGAPHFQYTGLRGES